MAYIQLGLFGKTSQELLHQTTGWISKSLFNPSQTPKFQCLVLEDGELPEWCEAEDVISDGASWMPNIGECPSAERESSLSRILEDIVPDKYYLSPKACEGILRRAERRGKKLPLVLHQALCIQAQMEHLMQDTTADHEPTEQATLF